MAGAPYSPTPEVAHAKADLRPRMRNILRAATPDLAAASDAACRALAAMREFRAASTIMLFLATAEELDPAQASRAALLHGQEVALPRMDWDAKVIRPFTVDSWPPRTERRRHGVPEPVDGRAIDPGEIGVIVVPGLAFDREGGRLGRGGGYYDRFLAQLHPGAFRVGFCLGAQVIERVPVDKHDARVHAVVSERGAIICSPHE